MSDFLQANIARGRNAAESVGRTTARLAEHGRTMADLIKQLGSGIAQPIQKGIERKYASDEAEKARKWEEEQTRLGNIKAEGDFEREADLAREMANTAFQNNLKLQEERERLYRERPQTGKSETEKELPNYLDWLFDAVATVGVPYEEEGRFELLKNSVPAFLGEWTQEEIDKLKKDTMLAIRTAHPDITAEGLSVIEGYLENQLASIKIAGAVDDDETDTGTGNPIWDYKNPIESIRSLAGGKKLETQPVTEEQMLSGMTGENAIPGGFGTIPTENEFEGLPTGTEGSPADRFMDWRSKNVPKENP